MGSGAAGVCPPDAPVREQQHVAMHVHVVMAGAYASVVLQHLVRTRVCVHVVALLADAVKHMLHQA